MTEEFGESRPIIRELALKEADRRWNEATERLKYAVDYAQAGLKGLFLANGAAIISLLTFLGHDGEHNRPASKFQFPLGAFALGLAATLLAYIVAYLTQAHLMNAAFSHSRQAESAAYGTGYQYDLIKFERRGTWAERLGIVFAVLALVAFVAGSFLALNAF